MAAFIIYCARHRNNFPLAAIVPSIKFLVNDGLSAADDLPLALYWIGYWSAGDLQMPEPPVSVPS
jgi:hypothetical protein